MLIASVDICIVTLSGVRARYIRLRKRFVTLSGAPA